MKNHNAHQNDGLQIPCVPAILLVKKLVSGELKLKGATPCVALVSLSEYLDELKQYDIHTFQE